MKPELFPILFAVLQAAAWTAAACLGKVPWEVALAAIGGVFAQAQMKPAVRPKTPNETPTDPDAASSVTSSLPPGAL